MKRLLEFILGLIGAVIGVFTAFEGICLMIVGQVVNDELFSFLGLISNSIGIFISVLAIICTCFIEKKTKMISKLLIICGILLFLTNFYQTIPATLLIVGGCVGLKRKVD